MMRRADREITAFSELLQVIDSCDVCRLAFHHQSFPYILPLNFGYREEDGQISLYVHGATEGTKYDLLRQDNRVAFEMDCDHRLVLDEANGHCTMEYRSVIGGGTLSIVTDEAEKREALRLLMQHYRKEPFRYNPAAIPRTTVCKLTVLQLTGKARRVEHSG